MRGGEEAWKAGVNSAGGLVVHGPDKIFITIRGTKPHHVFQQAYYPLITYLCDSNRDRVA